jgi:hypothetical protein
MVLENYTIQLNNIKKYKPKLDHNFSQNIKLFSHSVKTFFNRFKGTPVILVSTGPSLYKILLCWKQRRIGLNQISL